MEPAIVGNTKAIGGVDAAIFLRMLDEIDHGLLLVDNRGTLRYANQLGETQLREGSAVELIGGRVRGHHAFDQLVLKQALADCGLGRRRLFTAGVGETAISIAVVPMSIGTTDDPPLSLLVFGKCRAVEVLTVDFFARTHGLTATETSVLRNLCTGKRPKEVARAQGVAISTVRSQIASIRTKTHTSGIGELINRVVLLPPMTLAMKSQPPGRPEATAIAGVPSPSMAHSRGREVAPAFV